MTPGRAAPFPVLVGGKGMSLYRRRSPKFASTVLVDTALSVGLTRPKHNVPESQTPPVSGVQLAAIHGFPLYAADPIRALSKAKERQIRCVAANGTAR